MSENLHDIDKLFKDAIEGHKDLPGEDVWKSVEQKLDKSNVISINKKYQRLRRFAAILLLLLGGAGVYEIINLKNNKNENGIAGTGNKKEIITEKTPVKENFPSVNPYKNSIPKTFDSSVLGQKQNHSSIALSDTAANQNKKLYSNSNRSQTSAFAGDSLALKNKNVVEIKAKKDKSLKGDDKFIKENNEDINTNNDRSVKEKLSINKNFKNTKGNSTSKINNGNIDNVKESKYSNYDDDAILKRYFQPVESSSYQNKFDKISFCRLSSEKIILNRVPKATDEKNIAKNATPKTKNPKTSRFSLTPFYSPDITFNALQNDHPHQGPGGRRDDKHDIKSDERQGFDYTLGLLVDYALNKKLSLQAGVALSKSSTNTQAKNIYAEKDNAGNTRYRVNASCGYGYIMPPPNTNPAVGDSIKAVNAKNTLQYLTIPVALKYNIHMGKFSFIPAAGIQLNILTKGQIKTTTDNGSIKQTQSVNTVESLKKSYMSGIISAGIQYSVGKKIELQFVPTGRIGLNSINNGATVKTFSNSLGLSAGVKIKL